MVMKTYKIYGDDEDWYLFPPNWIHLTTVRAKSPKAAIHKALTTHRLIHYSWSQRDLKAVLSKRKKK